VATGRDRVREGKRDGLGCGIGGDLRCGLAIDGRRLDRHVDRVEHQAFGRCRHVDVD